MDMGICHHMVVFKSADGELHQFEFGPSEKRDIALPTFARSGLNTSGKESETPLGCIKESKWTESDYPHNRVFVGRSTKSLDDIKTFND
eukprot:gene33346-42742_t